MEQLPPKWMDRLLNWFCKPELVEEITGDLRELYFERLELQSKTIAQARYIWDILRFFRRSNIRFFQTQSYSQNSISMVKNYLTIAFRNLKKHPLNTVTNLLGLTIAVAYGIRAYAYYQWINKVDQFHDQKELVHMVTYFSEKEGNTFQYGNPPLPLAQTLEQNLPEIESSCRIAEDNIVVKHHNNVFYERIRYVDPSYLDMLSFPLKWGSKAALNDPSSVIISEEISEKYFGENNPVGVSVEFIFSPTFKRTFEIAGVAAEFPSASTMHFNFLLHFDNLQQIKPEFRSGNWEQMLNGTLVRVSESADIRLLEDQMEPYRKTYNAIDKDHQISRFRLEPIRTAYWEDIQDEFALTFLIDGPFKILGTIALFLLILSCFNYTNIAIFTATKRLKEIGLRKSLGAGRRMIISQFLIENIFVASITIFMGYVLAVGYVIPDFEKGIGMDLGLHLLDWKTLGFLVAILLLITILSGIYPAYYVSRYQAATIFRSGTTRSKNNTFTKVFLSIQLILAAAAITFSTMTVENANYIRGRSWGYDQQLVSYLPIPDSRQFETVKTALSKVSGVVSVSGSAHHLGKQHQEVTVEVLEQPMGVNLYEVDDQYIATLGLQVKTGRAFLDQASDLHTVLVNETFVKGLNLDDPVGATVLMDEEKYRIIGVLHDFHSYYFETPVAPAVLRLMSDGPYGYLSIKGEKERSEVIYEAMQAQWAVAFPDIPFQGEHQGDVWGSLYWSRIEGSLGFFHQISFICMLLVALGLYGLITLNVGGRIKEFSIRKVLGAEMRNVSRTIIRPYLGLFIIAMVIAIPLSYLFVDAALGVIWTYHVPMNFTGIILATSLLTMVLLIVVLAQVSRVMKSNPVDGLRVE